MPTFRARVSAVHRASVQLHRPAPLESNHDNAPLSADLSATVSATLDATLRRATDPLARPTVGDWVQVDQSSGADARVIAVEPRTTLLVRRAAGGEHLPQLLAANVDTALLFSPLPDLPNVRRLTRLTALAVGGQVAPVVVLSRADTASRLELSRAFDQVLQYLPDVPVISTSSRDDTGMQALTPWLWPGATVVLLGPSGAGKSSLINRLAGAELMATGATRRDGAGRHTTSHRALLTLPSGVTVIDTPGLREVGVWMSAGASDTLFRDIGELAEHCRFRDCRHEQEPGCAVLQAVATGSLDADRLAQWRQLQREAAHAERSDHERRRLEREGSLAARRMPTKGDEGGS